MITCDTCAFNDVCDNKIDVTFVGENETFFAPSLNCPVARSDYETVKEMFENKVIKE